MTDTNKGLPEQGTLSGDVRIRIYSAASDEADEWNMTLERIDFQRELSRMTAPDAIRIQHPQFHLRGRDLNMQYDQVSNQLQQLTLAQVEEILFENKPAAASEANPDKTETIAPATPKLSDKRGSKFYKLHLSNNVKIQQGTDQFLSDDLELYLDTEALNQPDALPSQTSDSPEKVDEDDNSNIKLFSESDEPIRLTCDGPLELTPIEPTNENLRNKSLNLILTGTPARMERNGITVMQADALEYDQLEQKIALKTASKQRPILLELQPGRVIQTNNEIWLDLLNQRGSMKGAGNLTSNDTTDDPFEIHFKEQMDFSYQSLNDQEYIESILFTGGFYAQTSGRYFAANDAQLTFFPPQSEESLEKKKRSKSQYQIFEHARPRQSPFRRSAIHDRRSARRF